MAGPRPPTGPGTRGLRRGEGVRDCGGDTGPSPGPRGGSTLGRMCVCGGVEDTPGEENGVGERAQGVGSEAAAGERVVLRGAEREHTCGG